MKREEYKRIARKLIDDSFPLLKNKKITVFVFRLSFFALSVWIPPWIRFIVMSTRTRELNENVITGILVHELCHQERYLKLGVFRYLRFALKFLTSRKAQQEEERATDKLTIEKGYGRQLFELTEISIRDKNHSEMNELYMSPDEIRAYSESIGKW
jgi:hypothetical protein